MIRAMNVILIVSAMQIRRFATSMGAALWLIGLPLLIILTLSLTLQRSFDSTFTPYRPFSVVVSSDAALPDQEALRPYQSDDALLRATIAPDEGAARRMVLERRADAAVIIPGDFPYAPVSIVAAPNSVAAGIVEGVTQAALEHWAELTPGAREVALRIEERAVAVVLAPGDSTPGETEAPFFGAGAFQYFTITIASLFAMFAAHTAMEDYVADRSTGIYTRVRATGVTRALYLFSGFINGTVRCVVFLACIAAITRLLFGVHWGDPAAWAIMTFAAAASAAALSFLAMAIAPNLQSVEPIGNLLFQVVGFLGGSMFPLHLFPDWLASSFRWLPNRVMIEGYFAVSKGGGLSEVRGEIMALGMAAIGLLAVGWILATVYKKGEVRQ